MNTVLLVEPRPYNYLIPILNEYYKYLGDNWNYIFYCGKGTLSIWQGEDIRRQIKPQVEFRELDVDNFPSPNLYSDFMKQKSLWESLEGEFVLTIQLDTWPMNLVPITVFLELNQSYIGGYMNTGWKEMERENIVIKYCNGNGGLSLRKRLDMIRVIDTFPPELCVGDSTHLESDAEDVYFYVGCYRLKLPIGNDPVSSTFACHCMSQPSFFGIHNPVGPATYDLVQRFPELKEINPFLKLHQAYILPDD